MTISRKFWAVLAVLAPLVVATGFAGLHGLASVKSRFDQVFTDNIRTSQASATLGADLARADEVALQLLSTTSPAQRLSLNMTLDQSVVPAVENDLSQLKRLHVENSPSERARVERLVRGWSHFVALRDSGVLAAEVTVAPTPKAVNRLATQINGIFAPLAGVIATDAQTEAAVGAALPVLVRAGDFVGRYGGEEFIILMPDTDTDGAAVAAEKIRAEIAEITVAGVERDITASLGVATIPQHAGTGDQLVRNADRTLYVARPTVATGSRSRC